MNIDRLVEVINDGGLAIVPTDTIYGIIADATNEDAINKVYEAKKRVYSKPLIIMISNREMLFRYVENISEIEQKLIERYWPGKLTILFKRSSKLSGLINNNGDLVGIRYPDNEELIELMNKLDRPLVSTSANIADEGTITSVDKISDDLLKYIDYVYDGGFREDVPSTIVKVVDNKIEFLRKGELASIIERDFM